MTLIDKNIMEIYEVIDLKGRKVIKVYLTAKRARNKAEKMNLEYGAHRYSVLRKEV